MTPGPGADPPFGLRLSVEDEKPPALHHGGYIDYGPPGGSYYYSRTRLRVSGEIQKDDGSSDPVDGLAWMDHQWGNFVVVVLRVELGLVQPATGRPDRPDAVRVAASERRDTDRVRDTGAG